jgi:hypothetical protein
VRRQQLYAVEASGHLAVDSNLFERSGSFRRAVIQRGSRTRESMGVNPSVKIEPAYSNMRCVPVLKLNQVRALK